MRAAVRPRFLFPSAVVFAALAALPVFLCPAFAQSDDVVPI